MNENYQSQQVVTGVGFLVEFISFLLVLITAKMTGETLVILDVFHSIAFLLEDVFLFFTYRKLTRNLKWEYNYGVGKLEAVASIVCDVSGIIGVLITMYYVVQDILNPEPGSTLLLVAVGIKLLNLVIDVVSYFIQKRVNDQGEKSRVLDSELMECLHDVYYDIGGLVGVLLVFAFRRYAWSAYISAVITVGISIYLLCITFHHIRESLDEILDRTIDEEYQLRLTSLLARHINDYELFSTVDSRRSGTTTFVDFHLTFREDTTYGEIQKLADELSSEVEESIEGSDVNIVIDGMRPSAQGE